MLIWANWANLGFILRASDVAKRSKSDRLSDTITEFLPSKRSLIQSFDYCKSFEPFLEPFTLIRVNLVSFLRVNDATDVI